MSQHCSIILVGYHVNPIISSKKEAINRSYPSVNHALNNVLNYNFSASITTFILEVGTGYYGCNAIRLRSHLVHGSDGDFLRGLALRGLYRGRGVLGHRLGNFGDFGSLRLGRRGGFSRFRRLLCFRKLRRGIHVHCSPPSCHC